MPDGPTQKPSSEGLRPEQFEPSREHREVKPTVIEARPSAPERPSAEGAPIAAIPSPGGPVRAGKSQLLQDIENVLEENLVPLYKELSPRQKQQFKTEGERTARSIEQLLKKTKIALVEIIRLIRRWLRLIPGINIFFLEQEAKIKAERIIGLAEEKKKTQE